MKSEKERLALLSKIDIANRWGLSKQGVNNIANRHPDFPDPITIIADGRVPVYSLEDIQAYEKRRNRKVKNPMESERDEGNVEESTNNRI